MSGSNINKLHFLEAFIKKKVLSTKWIGSSNVNFKIIINNIIKHHVNTYPQHNDNKILCGHIQHVYNLYSKQ